MRHVSHICDGGTVMAAKPSESELVLLKCLWVRGRSSARELHDATEGATGWSYSATRKTLDRMEAKGLVAVERVHGVKTFTATVKKLEVMAGLISHFANRVLDTDAPLPAAAFVGSRMIDPEEVEELDALLERLATEERS
jgi:predicted transcriptional regulator